MTTSMHASLTAIGRELKAGYRPILATPLPRKLEKLIAQLAALEIIVGTVAGLAAAYFLLGRIRISAGRSRRKVPRFNSFERFVHWLTAVRTWRRSLRRQLTRLWS